MKNAAYELRSVIGPPRPHKGSEARQPPAPVTQAPGAPPTLPPALRKALGASGRLCVECSAYGISPGHSCSSDEMPTCVRCGTRKTLLVVGDDSGGAWLGRVFCRRCS